MGHSARSSRLAEEILSYGFDCELLTSETENIFLQPWLDLSKEHERLSIIKSSLRTGSTEDLWNIEAYIAKKRISWIILDSYAFSDEQVATLRKKVNKLDCKLMVFEDFGNYNKEADLILNQNPSPTSGQFISKHNSLVLEGLNYFLCPRWVQEIRRQREVHNSLPSASEKHILISMGGADVDNLGLKISQELEKIR